MANGFFSGLEELHLLSCGVHVDSLTVVPGDLYVEFAMAGELARQRGQHCVVDRCVRDLPPQQHLVRMTGEEEDWMDKSSSKLLSQNCLSYACITASQNACTLLQ